MAKDIHWNELKTRCRQLNWRIKVNETELSITRLTNKSKIVLKTADNPDRLRGRGLDFAGIDEFRDMKQSVWQEIIRPALTDKKGIAFFGSTPAGKDILFDLYLLGQNQIENPEWKSWHYKTIDSPFIDPAEIEKAKKDLDLITFKQEYEASFENAGNSPYYSYSEKNINNEYKLSSSLPVVITCDFNATVKPMSWNIGQRQGNVTYWTKTFSYTQTNTETMCEIVYEYLANNQIRPPELLFYGDFAGKQQKSNSSYSDWQIIENHFRNYTQKFSKRIKPCKSVRNSIAATNSQMLNSFNESRQFYNSIECKELIKDFTHCKWKDNSIQLDESDNLRGHCSRAIDYYNDYEFPIKPKIISTKNQL